VPSSSRLRAKKTRGIEIPLFHPDLRDMTERQLSDLQFIPERLKSE
jgi:hypothetical protein